jgi:hypothetical protein
VAATIRISAGSSCGSRSARIWPSRAQDARGQFLLQRAQRARLGEHLHQRCVRRLRREHGAHAGEEPGQCIVCAGRGRDRRLQLDQAGVDDRHQQLVLAGEAAVDGGRPDAGAARDLLHRDVDPQLGEGRVGGDDDAVVVALRVRTQRPRWFRRCGHL